MNLTHNHRTLILNTIREKRITKKQIADSLGYGKAWVTKLLNGTLKSINDETVDKLEELLGVSFIEGQYNNERVSGLAMQVSMAVEQYPRLGPTLTELMALLEETASEGKFAPRYIETADMTRIGQEIIKLAFANEDKPGKVAREVLRLLS